MLTEQDVIESVCSLLESHQFVIVSTCKANERGDDIVATAPDGQAIYVEAKGETSSKASTSRYGKRFNGNQVTDHVAKALLRACRGVGNDQLWAIALPSNDAHRSVVQRILPALTKLEIEVFWVHANKTAEPQGIWKQYF